MAGAIIVAGRHGVSMSGLEFEHILGAIRPVLRVRDDALANEIWEPVDEGGMDFISVESLNKENYGVFCESAREACAQELKANPGSPFRRAWDELLDLLSADPRARPSAVGSLPSTVD